MGVGLWALGLLPLTPIQFAIFEGIINFEYMFYWMCSVRDLNGTGRPKCFSTRTTRTCHLGMFSVALPFHIDLTLHFQLKPWLYTIFTNSNGWPAHRSRDASDKLSGNRKFAQLGKQDLLITGTDVAIWKCWSCSISCWQGTSLFSLILTPALMLKEIETRGANMEVFEQLCTDCSSYYSLGIFRLSATTMWQTMHVQYDWKKSFMHMRVAQTNTLETHQDQWGQSPHVLLILHVLIIGAYL